MIYPIVFNDNTCPHCGKEKSVKFVDKYGNVVKEPIYPTTNLKCTSCDTEFFIKWVPEEDSDEMRAIITSDNSKDIFEEAIIKYSNKHRRKL